MPIWSISILGALVIGLSLLPFSARLKPLQGAGIVLGLILVLLPWLPPGRYSFGAGSYEKAAQVQVVATTNEQFNRMLGRIAAQERRIRLLETPGATPAQRRIAQEADLRARQNYNNAATIAAAARRRLINRLDVDIDTDPCCQGATSEQGPGNAPQGPEIDLPAMGRDDHGDPCCIAATEPVETVAR